MTTRSFASHGLRGVLLSGALAFCLASTGNSLAGMLFFVDDFEDGNHADGSPVTWSRYPAPFDRGDISVQNGSLVLTPPIDGPGEVLPKYWETDVVVENKLFRDAQIYTQARALESTAEGYIIGVCAGDTYVSDVQNSAVCGRLSRPLSGGQGLELDILTLQDASYQSLGQISTTLSPYETDVNLRLVVQGDSVHFMAWPEGGSVPLEPQISGFLPQQLRNRYGRVTLFAGNELTSVPVAFRFVSVAAAEMVPLGDFSANGSLDAADLDLLAGGMIAGDAKFDLDGDADADLADRLKWVNELKRTWMGDADLDGVFNSGDMVSVFTAGKYETGTAATWLEGDWNGDKLFSSGDLVTAFQGGGYEAGPRAGVAAVPEPSSCVLGLFSLLGLISTARARRT